MTETTSRLWEMTAAACLLLVLTAYFVFVASNVAYLGLDDLHHFLSLPKMWSRICISLGTASVSTALSLLIGVPAGYALSRFKNSLPSFVGPLTDIPIVLPPATIGLFLTGAVHTPPVSNLLKLPGFRFETSIYAVILVQTAVTAAFCARMMKSVFDGIDPRFESVSRSLGASPAYTFRRVTLPMASRGLAASAIIVWARALAEWEGLMLFVGGIQGRTEVLPFAIYLDWNSGMSGWVVSMSLVSLSLAVFSMGAAGLVGHGLAGKGTVRDARR